MNLLINAVALSLGMVLGLYLTQGRAADATAVPAEAGTTIVGERESPIGLYITPWLDAAAEPDIDRPARLLEERIEMLDEAVFMRRVEYHHALDKARASGPTDSTR